MRQDINKKIRKEQGKRMKIEQIYSAEELTELAKARFQEERSLDHLEGWFLAREIAMECDASGKRWWK